VDLPGEILQRSSRLREDKFAGLVAQHVTHDEGILLVDDCHAEMYEQGRSQRKFELVALLTTERLLLLRGRGVFAGPKKPFAIALRDIDRVAVTREGNVNIELAGPHGVPGLWKLIIENEGLADLWMATIHQACEELGRERGEALSRAQEELAIQRGGHAPSGDSPNESSRMTRLHDLIDDLRPYATPASFGQPLGEGCGLEEAMQHVFQRLESPDDVRSCGHMVMVDLVAGAQDDQTADDTAEIMGLSQEALMAGTIPKAAASLGGAAMELLAQRGGPGNIWDLWCRRDDVAVEMLCWHSIARLRLGNAGKMDPLTRPDGA
jgi:hypothetical protein